MAGKLSSNEAPLGAAPSVSAAVVVAGRHVGRYPAEAETHTKLASYLGVPPTQLLLSNGSDEMCYLIAALFLKPGEVAVLGDPCYAIDATVSQLAGAELRRIPLVDGGHDLAGMANAAADAAVVWLPSPHNPTGVLADPAELSDFLVNIPADCLVVLDEAYRGYADSALLPDSIALLERHPNLLVQRTLSKDFALAGLRVGYAIGSVELIGALAKIRAPFSVNSVALAAATAALAGSAWHDMSVARVRQERSRLEAELDALGIAYYPSQANFVTLRIAHLRLAPALEKAGLAVRAGEDLGLPGWIRISVGWAPQMAVLRNVLRQHSAHGRDVA